MGLVLDLGQRRLRVQARERCRLLVRPQKARSKKRNESLRGQGRSEFVDGGHVEDRKRFDRVGVRVRLGGRNNKEFIRDYTELTAACNARHLAGHVGFIRIQTPTSSPFSDEVFGK